MSWLIQSGLGVITAAANKITTTAYLRILRRYVGVIRPILVSINASTGSSNAMPQPSMRLVKLSK